jgi:hypothetical protein
MDLDTQRLPCEAFVVLMTRDGSSVMRKGLRAFVGECYYHTVPVPWLRHQANAAACNASVGWVHQTLLSLCISPFDCAKRVHREV